MLLVNSHGVLWYYKVKENLGAHIGEQAKYACAQPREDEKIIVKLKFTECRRNTRLSKAYTDPRDVGMIMGSLLKRNLLTCSLHVEKK